MRKNGKKPAATLMAERAEEEEAKKAKAAEVLGPQQELPGPPEAPTGEQVAAAVQGKLSEGPLAFDDLVLWTRQKFGTSMEVADGLVEGEITLGTVRRNGTRCYTMPWIEATIRELLKDGPVLEPALWDAIDAKADCPVEEVRAALDIMELRKVLVASPGPAGADGHFETCWGLAAVTVPEAIADVAKDRPDLVENAGTPEADAKEAHDDARDLRQDSKKLVSVLQVLQRRKTVRAAVAGLRSKLKDLQDELKGIDLQLEQWGEGEANIGPAPKPASGEPQDVELPFEEAADQDEQPSADEGLQELESMEKTAEPATPEPDGAPAAALVS